MGGGGRSEEPRPWTGAYAAGTAAVLACALPTLVSADLLPDPKVGWIDAPSVGTIAVATVIVFLSCCVLEQSARFALEYVFSTHPLLSVPAHRRVLARHVMDTVALCYVSGMGLSMLLELDWQALPTTAFARCYMYLPRFQWTCVCMLAFQTKNLIDTITYGDGPEFIAHHIVCIFVAVGSLHGSFLHLYGIFFFGLSEISTALVSLLAAFDEQHGIAELGEHFPLTKVAVGASFALAFIVIRAVAWPVLAYYVTVDSLAILGDGTAHAPLVVKSFLGGLLGLTGLQFFWLSEILRRAPAEIRAALNTSSKAKGKAS